VQQAVNLDARSITELQLDDAFVKPLEQRSFQRTINGRPWLVHEVRYAIFPEQSGVLEIPAQTFTAREAQPRRSLFDLGASGRPVRRTTEALRIEVLPRPADFPGQTWLPATRVEIEESWSVPPESLKAGESATRTLRIVGEGLQGAQLPPVTVPDIAGLKFYPDQPAINDSETTTGLTGERVDSAALVPTQAGSWELPEIRVPWWDTASEQVRYAIVPARSVMVSGTAVATASAPLAEAAGPIAVTPPPAVSPATAGTHRWWQMAAVVALLGWALTALAWLLSNRRGRTAGGGVSPEHPGESAAFKNLAAACAGNHPGQARQALIAWANAAGSGVPVTRIDEIQAALGINDASLAAALDALEAANFKADADSWDGAPLLALVKANRKQRGKKSSEGGAQELSLYPA
jgi:hypothetical protein